MSQLAPIPMILHCPRCALQHVDEPDEAAGWTNPPHRSHLCRSCGCIWRPADVATVGVRAIETRGGADTWPLLLPRRDGPRDDPDCPPESYGTGCDEFPLSAGAPSTGLK